MFNSKTEQYTSIIKLRMLKSKKICKYLLIFTIIIYKFYFIYFNFFIEIFTQDVFIV